VRNRPRALRAAPLVATLIATLVATLSAVPASAQTADSLVASCPVTAQAPRRCAIERLTRRVQARLGLTSDLSWDVARGAFISADARSTVTASVRYVTADTLLTAIAQFASARRTPSELPPDSTPLSSTAGTARAEASSDAVRGHPLPAAPSRRPAPAPSAPVALPTAPRLTVRVEPNATTVRLVVASPIAHPISYRLTQYRGDSLVSTWKTAPVPRCTGPSGVIIEKTLLTPDGAVTCWVRLTDLVDTLRPAVLALRVRTSAGEVAATTLLAPLVVPTYAIVAEPVCRLVAERVRVALQRRTVPIVSELAATRTLRLRLCEAVGLLATGNGGDPGASAYYIVGEITERTRTVFDDPLAVGPFDLALTNPRLDPISAAVPELVDRLLKYRTLP
jgi:hypothetical protein